MKSLLVHIALLMVAWSSLAQSTSTEQALMAYKDGNITEAKNLILQALELEENQTSPKVWNFKGHIFKKIYKDSGQDAYSEDRDIASEAFKTSCELSRTSKYYKDNIKALEFLSATYYNDAVSGAIDVRYDANQDPALNFKKYKELKYWMNPEADISTEELKFLKMVAQGFEKIHTKNTTGDLEFMEKAVANYEKALELDSLDYEANLNLAVIYYNEGAGLIGQISFETGFQELLDIQKNCVLLFKQALPFMQKANSIKPNHPETIKGLMFINRALNNFDKYLEYKVQLDKILKK